MGAELQDGLALEVVWLWAAGHLSRTRGMIVMSEKLGFTMEREEDMGEAVKEL